LFGIVDASSGIGDHPTASHKGRRERTMAILTKWQSWSYHKWLVVAGLLYLGVIVNLAIWNFPKSQFFNEIFTVEDVRLIFWVCVFWVYAIIIVFYLNIHYILLKNYKNIIIISNALLITILVLFTLICYEYSISYVNKSENDNKLFYSGGLILCLLASSIILVFLSVNYKWPEPENHGANAAFLIVTAFLFALLFSFPQLAIDEKDFAVEPSDNKLFGSCRQKGTETTSESIKSDLSTTDRAVQFWRYEGSAIAIRL
jgi:hypothetical protein